MRGLIVIVVLALAAGCMEKTEDPVDAASAEAPPGGDALAEAAADVDATTPAAPITIEGTVWLPPTQGQDRSESLVELPVAADGQTIRATLHLGSRYGGVDVPAVLTDVLVELRDPAGEVLAEASLTMDAPDAELEAISPGAGTAILAILSYGGSDGSANGDHVDYVVEIA